MNVSAPFIYRPIATTLLVVAIILMGLLGYRFLSVAALPTVEFPTIQVVTSSPGARRTLCNRQSPLRLNSGFGRIPGLTSMTSTSSFGTSEITLQFSSHGRLRQLPQTCKRRSTPASGWLPMTELPFPPTYHQVNPADMPVLSSRSPPIRCRFTQ